MKRTQDPTEKEHNLLFQFLHAIYPISQEAALYLKGKMVSFTVKKGKFVQSPNDREEYLFFIVKGVARGFIRMDGQDITTWLNAENTLIGSIRNMGLSLNTEEYIQALEDMELLGIRKADLEEMYTRFYEANIIGRKILEVYYRDAEDRAFLCRLPSAEKRYLRYLQSRPAMAKRVGLKYLASYLGMKLETLCRLRAKIKM